MFILREFQKIATVTLAFSNVRGSHSSVVQNNNRVKCLMVNRESDLIIQITIWPQYGKHHRKSHHEVTVNCESLLWEGTTGGNQICWISRKMSCLVCPCCSKQLFTPVSPSLRTGAKGKNLFWNKLESKNIETKPQRLPEHYWGKAIFNIIESIWGVRFSSKCPHSPA